MHYTGTGPQIGSLKASIYPPTVQKTRRVLELPRCSQRLEQLEQKVQQLEALVKQQQATIESLTIGANQRQQLPVSPFEAQRIGIGDRRLLGYFDARFHSTNPGATPRDYRILPERIILVRHAESEGNADNRAYQSTPDSQIPLTQRGVEQARAAGIKIKQYIERQGGSNDFKLFFYTSPYRRSLQTYEHLSSVFSEHQIVGVQEEVQLREQDFGNFQDPAGKLREKAERLRFGRFYFRFENGESSADLLDRLTVFEDHLVRDINAGRFANKINLVLVTHGLALRIFLMRWFHWTVDELLTVYNPPNAEPLVLERVPNELDAQPGGPVSWIHTKALYRLTPESMQLLKGCTPEMCSTAHMPRPRICTTSRSWFPMPAEEPAGPATISSPNDDGATTGSLNEDGRAKEGGGTCPDNETQKERVLRQEVEALQKEARSTGVQLSSILCDSKEGSEPPGSAVEVGVEKEMENQDYDASNGSRKEVNMAVDAGREAPSRNSVQRR